MREDLELRLKKLNRIFDAGMQEMKNTRERRIPVFQPYCEGLRNINVYFAAVDEFFIATYRAMPNPDQFRIGNQTQFPVLVWIRDVAQGFRPFISSIWLKRFDHVPMGLADAIQPTLNNRIETNIAITRRFSGLTIFDRKLGSVLDYARILKCQFEDKIVQRCPEIMNGITDREREILRDGWKFNRGIEHTLVLSDDAILAFIPKSLDQTVNLLDISICSADAELRSAQ